MPPLCIDLVYFNAGGGHRAAAQALQGALRDRHPGWSVRLVDLFRVLDPEGWFARLTGFAPETYYNKRLATGFTLGLAQELKVLQAMIRGAHPHWWPGWRGTGSTRARTWSSRWFRTSTAAWRTHSRWWMSECLS